MAGAVTHSKAALLRAELSNDEKHWRDKQPFLETRGYALRPRLRPGWTPSWFTNGKIPQRCEDFWRLLPYPNIVDATRITDGRSVFIKKVRTGDEEMTIALSLSREGYSDDPSNHCVPILDVFPDDANPRFTYIVMPLLRHVDNPSFDFVEDVVDFLDQILEGLVFLHEQGAAHRDCTRNNIMMDATSMYPKGFHPLQTSDLPDTSGFAPSVTRLAAYPRVRYYYIDFGLAVRIPPEVYPKRAIGQYGLDQDVPELSLTTPYDPFLVDVFILGNFFKKYICEKSSNLNFLSPLAESMTRHDPNDRPDATRALQQWRGIRSGMWLWQRGCRVRQTDEGGVGARIRDLIGFFRLGFALSRRFVLWTAHLLAVLNHSVLPIR